MAGGSRRRRRKVVRKTGRGKVGREAEDGRRGEATDDASLDASLIDDRRRRNYRWRGRNKTETGEDEADISRGSRAVFLG